MYDKVYILFFRNVDWDPPQMTYNLKNTALVQTYFTAEEAEL